MIQSMRVMCREYTEIAPNIKILYFPVCGIERQYALYMRDAWKICARTEKEPSFKTAHDVNTYCSGIANTLAKISSASSNSFSFSVAM